MTTGMSDDVVGEDRTMDGAAIAWTSEMLPGDIMRIAFSGSGGTGSEGNADGKRMCAVVCESLADQPLKGLIVDLSAFDYQFGDWIATVPLAALRHVGTGRVCVVACGGTKAALDSLWPLCRISQAMPLFSTLNEALHHLRKA